MGLLVECWRDPTEPTVVHPPAASAGRDRGTNHG
jgi:hypothetical protein